MPEYSEFLGCLAIILIIIVLNLFYMLKNYSPIEIEVIDKKTEKWFIPKFSFLIYSIGSIVTAILLVSGLSYLLLHFVTLIDQDEPIMYFIIFVVIIITYIYIFKFFICFSLEFLTINALVKLNLLMELLGTFLLGLIIFIDIGSESPDKDIDSLFNNFMITIFVLSFIAVTHYYTNKIISSKSDIKIKDEIAVSIEELTVGSHNNRFVELEKQIEELKREQQAIAIKIAKPKGFVEKLIAILQIISSK